MKRYTYDLRNVTRTIYEMLHVRFMKRYTSATFETASHEVLELLKLISADEAFTKVEPELLCNKQQEQGGMTMYNMVQAIREQGFANGERQGV